MEPMVGKNIYLLIEQLLRCPVDWPSVTGRSRNDWLLFDWYSCLMQVAVSVDETAAISQIAKHGQILDGRYDEYTIANFTLRMDEAKTLFWQRSGRLAQLDFLAPSNKHFRPHLTRQDILARTQTSYSLFFESYDAKDIKKAFWNWFESFFDIGFQFDEVYRRNLELPEYHPGIFEILDRFLTDPQFRVGASAKKDIGAVAGRPSRFICFDVGVAASVVHAYPVSQEEALKTMAPSYVFGVELFE
jgi:hypothetical protein